MGNIFMFVIPLVYGTLQFFNYRLQNQQFLLRQIILGNKQTYAFLLLYGQWRMCVPSLFCYNSYATFGISHNNSLIQSSVVCSLYGQLHSQRDRL